MNYPKALVDSLSLIDRWEFNVFDVADASKQRPLTYVLYELLKKYDLLSTFKVPPCQSYLLPEQKRYLNTPLNLYSSPQKSMSSRH